MSDQKKNWRTTTLGILGAVGVIVTAASAGLDNDPETVVDMAGLVQAVGVLLSAVGLGGAALHAKDAKADD